MHWFKKNDQGTAGCRPDSPAIPSSSASCTSNCCRYVLSDMVDVGWVFLKMTPMLDVSLSLSLWTCGMAKTRHWKPGFNLAMKAKLPQDQQVSHFFLPNWENVGRPLGSWSDLARGFQCNPREIGVTILMWLHLTELRSKNPTKTPKKHKTSTSFEFGVDKIYIFYCNPVAPHFPHLNSKDFLCFKQCHTAPALGSFGVIQAPF